jgi:hypothetical protein
MRQTAMLGTHSKAVNRFRVYYILAARFRAEQGHSPKGTKTINDAPEFPDGRTVLLALLCEAQAATILQLPAQPTNAAETREQERVGFLGWCALGAHI